MTFRNKLDNPGRRGIGLRRVPALGILAKRATGITLGNCLAAVAITAVSLAVLQPIAASAKSPTSIAHMRKLASATAMYAEDYDSMAATPCLTEGDGFVNDAAGCSDTTSGLIWSGSIYLRQSYFPTWYQARDYCAALTDGGLSGWRLPTKTEMQSAATRQITYHVQQAVDPYNRPNPWYSFSGTLQGPSYVYTVDLRTGAAFKALIYDKRWGTYTQVDGNCVRSAN